MLHCKRCSRCVWSQTACKRLNTLSGCRQRHSLGSSSVGTLCRMLYALCKVTRGSCKPFIPESVCTMLLLHLVALLLLVVCSCLPAAQTGQQQVVLLAQGVIHLPLLLTHLKHSCQLCLQQTGHMLLLLCDIIQELLMYVFKGYWLNSSPQACIMWSLCKGANAAPHLQLLVSGQPPADRFNTIKTSGH